MVYGVQGSGPGVGRVTSQEAKGVCRLRIFLFGSGEVYGQK